jgi:hypothetical protein
MHKKSAITGQWLAILKRHVLNINSKSWSVHRLATSFLLKFVKLKLTFHHSEPMKNSEQLVTSRSLDDHQFENHLLENSK